jgi:hypothetical protein
VSDDFIDCNIIEPNINSLIGKIYNSSINNEEFVVLRCEDNIVDNTTFRNFICIFDFVTYVSEIIGKHESFNDGVSFDIGERYPISMSEFISIYNSVCEKNAKFTLGEVEKLTRDTLSIHISELLDNGAHKNNSLPFAIKSHYK